MSRRGAVPVWGTAFVGALAGLLGGWGPGPHLATARADTSSPVALLATVYAPDGSGSTDSLTVADLASCPAYSGPSEIVEHTQDGRSVTVDLPSAQPGTPEGTWGLGDLLGCLARPIPLADVQSVAVLGSDGSPEGSADSLLVPSAQDLSSPSDFADPQELPTLSDLGSTLQYNRPARSAGDADFSDQTSETVGSAPIGIEVYEGRAPLSVTVTAPSGGATTVPAGATVSFAASVSGGHGSGTDGYVWSFGGGASPGSSTAATPTVRYSDPGVYRVTLQVTDGAGDVGQAAPVTVTVTGASTSTPATTPVAPAVPPRPVVASGASPTGPARGGGHRPAPSAAHRGVGTTANPPVAPAPLVAPAATAPARTVVRSRPRRPVAHRSGSRAVIRGGAVAGRLIAAPRAVAPSRLTVTRGSVARRTPGPAPAEAGAGPSLPLGGLIGVGLLGLGAVGELRGPRRVRSL